MKVCVDAMGGDHAPGWVVKGALQASFSGIPVILVGDEKRIKKEAKRLGGIPSNVEIVHASEAIGMDEAPTIAVRKKKDSSLRVGFKLVREGKAGALISAGNSGAIMAAAIMTLRRIPGVDRPAIATLIPTFKGHMVLLDIGANVDCRPDHLRQFAVVGTVFCRTVLHIPFPRVAILSNGEETSKGNTLTREAHQLLSGSFLNYIGYVEGRDIFSGDVDVVVCDGFVGNIVLKLTEGLSSAIFSFMKSSMRRSFSAKIGYLFIKGALRGLLDSFDYSEYGGAPLLGVDGVCLIAHGSSPPKAIKNAIFHAHELASQNLVERMRMNIQRLKMNGQPGTEDKDANGTKA